MRSPRHRHHLNTPAPRERRRFTPELTNMHDQPIRPIDVVFAIAYGIALGLLLAAFI